MTKEKGLEVGRHLKGKKELSNKIKELAEAEGKKPADLIAEAIELYSTLKDVKDKKVEDLMAGIMFYKLVMNDALKYLNTINELYASEYMRLLISLVSQPAEQPSEQMSSEQKTFMAETMTNVMNLLTNMMASLVSNLTNVLGKPASPQQQSMEFKNVKIE